MTIRTITHLNLEVNKQVRQDSLTFLDQHSLIPDRVYLSADGWVEALYDVPTGDKTILRIWNQLESDGLVELATLPRYQEKSSDYGRIDVHFRLNPPSPSFWQRLIG